jgi:hypothetical protein
MDLKTQVVAAPLYLEDLLGRRQPPTARRVRKRSLVAGAVTRFVGMQQRLRSHQPPGQNVAAQWKRKRPL